MKKYYNIKTGEEQKSYNGLCATDHINVTISFDESYISFNSYTKIDQDFIDKSQDFLDRHGDYYHNTSKKIERSTPTDPILARLCELTRGKMYGDYVVLSCFTGIGKTLADQIVYTQGDVYKILMQQDKPIEQRNHVDYIDGKITDTPLTLMIGFYNGNHDLIGDGVGYYRDIRSGDISILEYLNNAFEEYSKHLRNEENKFEEIKQLLNL